MMHCFTLMAMLIFTAVKSGEMNSHMKFSVSA